MDAGGKLSIYRAARSIKRRDNNLYNALRSIHEDSIFVGEISQLWPDLPLLANLRCGLWYTPKFYSTCYFKSTDGHQNNWSFSTTRLNLHVALLAGQKGGCIIVDSTRRGKRFPDSMSKTIPIWSCVLNRAIFNYVKNSKRDGNSMMKEEAGISNHAENARVPSPSWDCSLHLPIWVPEIEKAAIEERLEGWINQLEASGADLVSLASCLKKPLRPLWISQKTVIWLNEVPHHDSWDFTPIILVSASSPSDVYRHRTTSEFSWSYIAGAGDDEESWARGLSPGIFWNHAYDLIAAGPDLCNQKVADIVEKERVYRAQRGQIAPQITVRAPKTLDNIADLSHEQPSLSSDMFDSGNTEKSPDEERTIYWLGSTNLAVGTTQFSMHNSVANMSNGDCILNCDQESISVSLPDNQPYLHLPMVSSKMERFSILRNLPAAVNFAELNLSKRNRILVCCCSGEDISVCVCLAILISLFNEEGTFDHGNSFREKQITKLEMRRRLVFICQFAIRARPSRGNLRQVFGFLTGGGAGLTGRSPSLLSPGIDGNLQE